MNRTVVVVGAGAREHALAWKLSRSSRVSRLIVAPGNDGFSSAWERWPSPLGGRSAFEAFARQAKDSGVDLVVVGPDNPLAEGLVDVLESHGIKAFGPTQAAARIEASKGFAKEVMAAAGVPTAAFRRVKSAAEAEAFLESVPWGSGWVIKADGLALGKGVRVCESRSEALTAARELIGISGELVIEERLAGKEISWLAFCDGDRAALLEPARDFKRLRDGDLGPNTGGMGAFSPVPGVPEKFWGRVRTQVFEPVLREMKRRGTPFRGVLYAGLMVQDDRFWVLEFNARWGDPETQVLVPRITDDLYDWFEACAQGDLSALPARVGFSEQAAVVVVAASRGYPENPERGQRIAWAAGASGFSASPDVHPRYFAAGVEKQDRVWVTAGGRVLNAVGMGATLVQARDAAYASLSEVSFEGMQYRKDVAQ